MNGSLRTAGLTALLSITLVLASGCGSDPAPTDADTSTGPAASGAGVPDGVSPEMTPPSTAEPSGGTPAELNRFAPGGPIADADLGKYHVTMSCSIDGSDIGTMTFALWTDLAPITTRNFLRLCDEGFYDGITFHRILREFMIQGGDPTGQGSGNSPHGKIKGEMTDDPEREHGYGVLSMARFGQDMDSASSQFFLCCDESPSVWGLDGKYSSFGRLTNGVATLEAIANVPVVSRGREASSPTQTVVITKATVVEGEAPTGDVIERPSEPLDLGGEPERVIVQHVLISFAGCGLPEVTRTKEEAEALAQQVLTQARDGGDMNALVRENSDDPVHAEDETPGQYGLLNLGVRDRANERAAFLLQNELQAEFMKSIEEMQTKLRSAELSQEDYQTQAEELQSRAQMQMMNGRYMPRDQMVPAFGDVGFTLEVGGVGLAPYDETKSPFGFHVIKRLE